MSYVAKRGRISSIEDTHETPLHRSWFRRKSQVVPLVAVESNSRNTNFKRGCGPSLLHTSVLLVHRFLLLLLLHHPKAIASKHFALPTTLHDGVPDGPKLRCF